MYPKTTYKKVKKPKWAILANCAYKIVTNNLQSPISPFQRLSSVRGVATGVILHYELGTLVTSPNGVDILSGHSCSRGIHAYATFYKAQLAFTYDYNQKIIRIYAKRWYGNRKRGKIRAKQVWVDEVVL